LTPRHIMVEYIRLERVEEYKSEHMTARLYQLDTNFELRLDDVCEFFEDYDPPAEIEEATVERKGNKLIVNAVGTDSSSTSRYSPTARLKASVKERRMYETEDGWAREPPKKKTTGFDDEDEVESEVFEYVCFRGGVDTVLQNSDLQYSMFRVLCDLAEESENGNLTAVVGKEDKLSATRIVDGEECDASVEVVEKASEGSGKNESTSDWRNNKYIS